MLLTRQEISRYCNMQHGTLATWLSNYRFDKYFVGNKIELTPEFFNELEEYVLLKTKKNTDLILKHLKNIRNAKNRLLTA